ncbi:MAG TPA: hypothetical protein VM620_16345 [Hyphomicrobium sp.]|jgi:hypothetical protein|nr:hypothetical protein [Hyphomicrobium sp.]
MNEAKNQTDQAREIDPQEQLAEICGRAKSFLNAYGREMEVAGGMRRSSYDRRGYSLNRIEWKSPFREHIELSGNDRQFSYETGEITMPGDRNWALQTLCELELKERAETD